MAVALVAPTATSDFPEVEGCFHSTTNVAGAVQRRTGCWCSGILLRELWKQSGQSSFRASGVGHVDQVGAVVMHHFKSSP